MNQKFVEEQDIYTLSKSLPTNYILITKGKRVTIMDDLNQVIKVDIISNGTTQIYVTRAHIIFVMFLPKMHSLESNHKETSDNPNQGIFFIIMGIQYSKSSEGLEVKSEEMFQTLED